MAFALHFCQKSTANNMYQNVDSRSIVDLDIHTIFINLADAKQTYLHQRSGEGVEAEENSSSSCEGERPGGKVCMFTQRSWMVQSKNSSCIFLKFNIHSGVLFY